jgi:septal ring factor EnvC (AmiA/AmiB activator)
MFNPFTLPTKLYDTQYQLERVQRMSDEQQKTILTLRADRETERQAVAAQREAIKTLEDELKAWKKGNRELLEQLNEPCAALRLARDQVEQLNHLAKILRQASEHPVKDAQINAALSVAHDDQPQWKAILAIIALEERHMTDMAIAPNAIQRDYWAGRSAALYELRAMLIAKRNEAVKASEQ